MLKRLSTFTLLILVCVVHTHADSPAKIGVLMPFSGDVAAIGAKMRSGFVEAFRKRFQSEPDLYAAEAYDLLTTAIQALKDNNWSKQGLSARLPALSFNDTAIPGFRFRTDRTVSFPMGVLVAEGGRFVPAGVGQ